MPDWQHALLIEQSDAQRLCDSTLALCCTQCTGCVVVLHADSCVVFFLNYCMSPKNETRISCTVASLLQWNLARDILMALAIKCLHNLNTTSTIDELKHWHLGPYSSRHHQQSRWPVQTWLHACVKVKGRHFEHLLWSRHTTGSFQSLSHYWEEDNISFQFLCNIR